VRDPGDEDETLSVVNRVDDAVLTHSHAEVVSARQLLGAARPRVGRQAVDRGPDAVAQRPAQTLVLAGRGPVQADLIAPTSGFAYGRTSLQETLASRSSRA
jgi:hypothetical protein